MSNEIKFACSGCGQHIACETEHAGAVIACPTCTMDLVVPELSALSPPAPVDVPTPTRFERPDRETWKAMGIGLAIAVVVGFVPLLSWVFSYLSTMVHELGHWLVAMAFAYPSVPAFHLDHGGVTLVISRMPLLLIGIYAFWGWLLWQNRRNRAAFAVLGALAAIYALLAHSGGDRIVALAAGHGTELLVATLFLYRAWSGSAILVPAERPVYAAVGLSMAWEQFSFALLVLVDPAAREAYINRPDAENDFVRLNQQLGIPLDVFMLAILVGAVLVPVVSFLAFRYRPWWRRVLGRNP